MTGHVETCAKNALDERDAVSEMEVGPSKSVCRSRLQTAVSCFSPKGCGGERYGKSRGKSRHVWIREMNDVNPCKQPKVLIDIKTRACLLSGISIEETYLLAMWCPVYKGHDSNLGSDT